MSFVRRAVTAAGLLLGLSACSNHSIEGGWTCDEETREYDATGNYLHTQADGGFSRGVYRHDGDLLITKPNRVRNRVSPADRALTSQMLLATSNHQGLAELLNTGFVTMDTPNAGEYGDRIDVLNADRLELTSEFFPGNGGEPVKVKQGRKTICERTPSPEAQQSDLPAQPEAEQESEGLAGRQPPVSEPSAPEESAAPPLNDAGLDSGAAETGEDLFTRFVPTSCIYSGAPEYFGTLRIDRVCTDMSPTNQQCRSFAVTFPNGRTLTNVDVGIEPGADDILPFIALEPTFYEEEFGGDGYGRWAINLFEWGGGKFAAERVRIFDDAGEPISPLLEPTQFEKWKALRHIPDQGSFFESKVQLSEQCN